MQYFARRRLGQFIGIVAIAIVASETASRAAAQRSDAPAGSRILNRFSTSDDSASASVGRRTSPVSGQESDPSVRPADSVRPAERTDRSVATPMSTDPESSAVSRWPLAVALGGAVLLGIACLLTYASRRPREVSRPFDFPFSEGDSDRGAAGRRRGLAPRPGLLGRRIAAALGRRISRRPQQGSVDFPFMDVQLVEKRRRR